MKSFLVLGRRPLHIFSLTTYVLLALSLGSFFPFPLSAETLTLSCPHKNISFTIEVARTPEEKEKGLMFRTSLPTNGGMLFLYSSPQPVAMWMKNTLLPLDIIFANQQGKILETFEQAVPYSLTPLGPVRGTTQVLEILGGTIKTQGITKDCTLSPGALQP